MNEFRNQTINCLRDSIAAGKTSATGLCLETLELVARRNDELGILTDVLSTTALREADDIDRLVASGERVGILAGIPVVIKDNIDTVPAVCSAGLPSLSGYRPEFDAAVVKSMREQGAVIIGVAATDSGAFGVVTPNVKNPKYPDKIAGGSSGGPAAAVAAGFCKVAIGTDSGGSIRIPAACCGIAGLKPTFSRVPSIGVRPLSVSVDHIGPLALCIADLRTVMEIFPSGGQINAGQTSSSQKIGIPKAYFSDASAEVKHVVEDVAQCCSKLGHNVRTVSIPTPDEIIPTHLILSLTEAARFHLGTGERDIAGYPNVAKESILLGQSYLRHEYESAVDVRRDFVSQIDKVFADIDFLLLPTLPLLPPDIGQNEVAVGTRPMSILHALIRYTAAFDQSGHPALALPWAVSDSNSVGSIQLVGRLDSDLQLLAFAEQIEKARDAHQSSRPAHW